MNLSLEMETQHILLLQVINGSDRKRIGAFVLQLLGNCAPWHRVLSEQYYTLLRACLDKRSFSLGMWMPWI